LLQHATDRQDPLERELGAPQAQLAPALGSFVLHGALAGGMILFALVSGLFHHNLWGSNASGGAIEVKLVSSALPLPADHPPNENVLATETPSEAPAPPTPKEEKTEDLTAIPITGKPEKPKPLPTPPKTEQHQPQPVEDNHAHYGEQQAASMPRSTEAQNASNGPVSIANGDFGSRYPWYVEAIKRQVSQNWYRAEVDQHTAKGTKATIYFRINRQGTPSDFKIYTSSGNSTLDRSGVRAVERVDSFGPLPSDANLQYLDVSYDFTY
jgi:periplasmic protein TonB